MRQHASQHSVVLFLVLTLQVVFSLAASVKSTYTLAYVPVGPSSSKPTPFAVLVSSPSDTDATKQSRTTSGTQQQSSKPNGGAQQQRKSVVQQPHLLSPDFSLESYTAPGKKESATRAQIGILAASGKIFNGSSTLASISALKEPLVATLYIHLGAEDEAQSITLREDTMSLAASSADKPAKKVSKGSGAKDVQGPALEIVRAAPEPRPILNKPVVLNAEGRVDVEVKEKTLLQKYWWIGMVVLAVSLMSGGENK